LYYKLTDEDMEQITKEWPKEFLVHVVDAKLSDTNTIGNPIVTQVEHFKHSSGTKKKKKQEEVQDIESNKEDNVSEDNGSGSPGGGEDEVEGQG
jgi:carbamoylphosphate synthase large subunit